MTRDQVAGVLDRGLPMGLLADTPLGRLASPSIYALSSPAQFLAESYLAHRLGRPYPGKGTRWISKIIRQAERGSTSVKGVEVTEEGFVVKQNRRFRARVDGDTVTVTVGVPCHTPNDPFDFPVVPPEVIEAIREGRIPGDEDEEEEVG